VNPDAGRAARVQAHYGHGVTLYHLGSFEAARAHFEQALEVTGRTIEFYQVPIEQVREGSAEFAIMLEWFDAVGYDADIEGTAKEFGVKPTRFGEWAREQDWS
jgi:hypothetical protein